jgi:ABC-type antimicrobial peptide transport system permease subunit
LALVTRDAFSVIVTGVVSGVAGALLVTRVMTSLLFGVSPADPTVYLAISALLLGVAAVACWIPARRAIRIDPVCALGYE